jgi:hypothetical protein
VIVCEDPLDALAIAAAAAQHRQSSSIVAVARSGTALTAEQARHVFAISTNAPIICADGVDRRRCRRIRQVVRACLLTFRRRTLERSSSTTECIYQTRPFKC